MQNARLDEAQAGMKIAGRNINNLSYADDSTLMAESKRDLKSLLMKVKEESEKAGLKHDIQKTKVMASGPISSVQFSRSVVSDSLQPHGLQHSRTSCPSTTPGVYSNSCHLSWSCHPTISSSVIPFSHLQIFPASGSFTQQERQVWSLGGEDSLKKGMAKLQYSCLGNLGDREA